MSRSIKRNRRTKREIEQIREAIVAIVEEARPMSVRQVFYQLVTSGLIDKSESEYKMTVVRLLTRMRHEGCIDFCDITDNTRWQRKPQTYTSLADMLELSQETYRRALWGNQDAYVEIWLEKEALSGVLLETTAAWDVPLMVTRGYPSVTFLHARSQII